MPATTASSRPSSTTSRSSTCAWSSPTGRGRPAVGSAPPERVERLVVMTPSRCCPATWRRSPGCGACEASAGRRRARHALGLAASAPAARGRRVLARFDGRGTRILALPRRARSTLARAGLDLGRIDLPTLVVWGDHDPSVPQVRRWLRVHTRGGGGDPAPAAGHWPWLNHPDVINGIAAFLDALRPSRPWGLAAAVAAASVLWTAPARTSRRRSSAPTSASCCGTTAGCRTANHMPGYSMLFPPLAALLGPRLVGALSAVAAPGCSSASCASTPTARGSASLWFAVAGRSRR